MGQDQEILQNSPLKRPLYLDLHACQCLLCSSAEATVGLCEQGQSQERGHHEKDGKGCGTISSIARPSHLSDATPPCVTLSHTSTFHCSCFPRSFTLTPLLLPFFLSSIALVLASKTPALPRKQQPFVPVARATATRWLVPFTLYIASLFRQYDPGLSPTRPFLFHGIRS